MHKAFLAVATASLFVGVTATPSLAQKDKGGTLTIAVAPTSVAFGKQAKVTGAISTKAAGVALTLQSQPYPYTGKFSDVGTATTVADGAYSFTVLPTIGTHYRVETVEKPASQSAEAPLLVRWAVGFRAGDTTPKKGASVRFSGTVKPANANAAVLIQRFSSAGWKTVKQTTLTTSTATSSSYSVRVKITRNGKYRIAVLAANGYETGTSRVRKFVVH